MADLHSGRITLDPDAEVQTFQLQPPNRTAWFKIAPGVFVEHSFDRSDFDTAMQTLDWVDGTATGRVRVILSDAERVDA